MYTGTNKAGQLYTYIDWVNLRQAFNCHEYIKLSWATIVLDVYNKILLLTFLACYPNNYLMAE